MSEPRFTMMETMRAYALDSLQHADELEEVRRLHAMHYVTRAARLDRHRVLTTREHMAKELTTFRLEQQNFREVLAWATSPPDLPEPVPNERRALALALLAKVWWILMHRDPGDCRHWLEATLEQPGTNDTADVGRCLLGHAEVVGIQADWSQARESARRSVTILQAHGDRGLPEALGALGAVEIELGAEQAGRRALEQAVDEARRVGDDRLVGDALAGLAYQEVHEENWEQALDLLHEALRRYPAGADDYGGGQADATIALVLHKLGRAEEAHAQLSAHLCRWMHHESSLNLASYAEDYLVMLAEAGFVEFTPLLLGACDAERERLGLTRDEVDEAQVAAASKPARAAMTQVEWTDTYARGRGILIKDALAEAISATTDLPV